MALSENALPFGLRDVKIFPRNADGTRGTGIDLPASRTFSFSEEEDYETLDGDDASQGSHGHGPHVAWSLEGGGISFSVWAALSGATVTESGVTPSAVRKLRKLTTDARPYFDVEGQVISDSGGDIHCIVYRCKADDTLEGEFSNGAFFLTSAGGTGFGNLGNGTDAFALYDLIQNETTTAIVTG